ncbi:MAG TPA: ThiF family adenylyltransferase [Tepidisphaeraceae bacterium]|nr:ThiF family adenylyltransferase [Tepidisphaeraceae bacterium]
MTNRYHRQTLLPQIGKTGQARLSAARVLLVGCGALGTVLAEQLVRAGVGTLRIVDRDVVELTNLQRQVLFDENDAKEGTPKSVAAGKRLGGINSSVKIEPLVVDLHAGNVEELAGLELDGARVDLILDGTDSAETRYLLNDVAVKHGVPWVYGACVGMEGRMMAIRPPTTACLRCLFPSPPGPGELPTCDTAGVFSPVAAMVASLQTTAAIKLLTGAQDAVGYELFSLDLWNNRIRTTSTIDAKRADCIACGRRQFQFLEHRAGSASTSLCGRNAIQVRPAGKVTMDFNALESKLGSSGAVERTPHLVRCQLNGPEDLKLTVFRDGRLIVQGTGDSDRARSIYARYIGA